MAVLAAAMILMVRTHEHAVDTAVVDFFAQMANGTVVPPTPVDGMGFSTNMTATQTAYAVANLNQTINFWAARGTPLLLLVAVILIAFGVIGIKAAQRDVKAAQRYTAWKLAHAFMSLFSFSPVNILLSVYAALITKSHFANLVAEAATPALPQTTVHVHLVQAAAPKASANLPQKAKTLN